MTRLPPEHEARFWAGVAAAEAFFMGKDPVHAALQKIAKALDELAIPVVVR
jgi:hypothetical protein